MCACGCLLILFRNRLKRRAAQKEGNYNIISWCNEMKNKKTSKCLQHRNRMGVNAIQVNQSHKMMKDFPASIIKCDVIYLVMIINEGKNGMDK